MTDAVVLKGSGPQTAHDLYMESDLCIHLSLTGTRVQSLNFIEKAEGLKNGKRPRPVRVFSYFIEDLN